MPNSSSPGWRSRGRLPHADFPGLIQAITFRLGDSLPQSVLQRMLADISRLPPDPVDPERQLERRRRIQTWLDGSHGSCVLRRPKVMQVLSDGLHHGDGTGYILHAFSIMPNHVHVLVSIDEASLGSVVRAWKGTSARRINQMLGRSGPLWAREYYDRYVRDEEHAITAIRYTLFNPVSARLVRDWSQWPGNWVSAEWRRVMT